MTFRIAATASAAVLAIGCVAYADDDDDRRARGEARAEKRCAREAEDQGLRVERVGDAERVGKKEYEVRLRVDDDRDGRYGRRDRDRDRDDDEFRVTCRYDDRSKSARIY